MVAAAAAGAGRRKRRLIKEQRKNNELMADMAHLHDAEAELTPEQFKEVRTAFDTFDVDRSGVLDIEEMTHALQLTGIFKDGSEVNRMISEIDLNQDGTVCWEEFLHFYAVHLLGSKELVEDEMQMAFEMLCGFCPRIEHDEANSRWARRVAMQWGRDEQLLDVEQIAALLCSAGTEPLTPAECAAFLDTVDPGRMGVVRAGDLKTLSCFAPPDVKLPPPTALPPITPITMTRGSTYDSAHLAAPSPPLLLAPHPPHAPYPPPSHEHAAHWHAPSSPGAPWEEPSAGPIGPTPYWEPPGAASHCHIRESSGAASHCHIRESSGAASHCQPSSSSSSSGAGPVRRPPWLRPSEPAAPVTPPGAKARVTPAHRPRELVRMRTPASKSAPTPLNDARQRWQSVAAVSHGWSGGGAGGDSEVPTSSFSRTLSLLQEAAAGTTSGVHLDPHAVDLDSAPAEQIWAHANYEVAQTQLQVVQAVAQAQLAVAQAKRAVVQAHVPQTDDWDDGGMRGMLEGISLLLRGGRGAGSQPTRAPGHADLIA